MSEEKKSTKSRRVLGDEWVDWDGKIEASLEKTKHKLFLLVSILGVIAVIGLALLFLWLIYPRITEISAVAAQVLVYAVMALAVLLVLWLSLFVFCSIFNIRLIAPLVLVPRFINFILNLTLKVGEFIGIPRDKMVNSFMKAHNILMRLRRMRLKPQELLILLPRCLGRDYFHKLRELKERYQFQMFTVGGGQAARQKIRMLMPRAIIAVACERDLLSGFVEINPKIPVIGLPNRRPQGPCKNTEVDIGLLESAVRHLLQYDK